MNKPLFLIIVLLQVNRREASFTLNSPNYFGCYTANNDYQVFNEGLNIYQANAISATYAATSTSDTGLGYVIFLGPGYESMTNCFTVCKQFFFTYSAYVNGYGCSCGDNIMASSINSKLCTKNVCPSKTDEYCGGPDNGSGTGKAAIIFKNFVTARCYVGNDAKALSTSCTSRSRNYCKTILTIASGIYQYSCENSCSASSSAGKTITCCAIDNCNTVYKISTCFVGTDTAATSTSCTDSGFCKTDLNTTSGVYQYSCAATCTAGSSSGVTTECCYSSSDCNAIHQVSSCYVGTDSSAAITSCTDSVYCKTELNNRTGVHVYSCAATCKAGTIGGITTTCCNSNDNCNADHTLSLF